MDPIPPTERTPLLHRTSSAGSTTAVAEPGPYAESSTPNRFQPCPIPLSAGIERIQKNLADAHRQHEANEGDLLILDSEPTTPREIAYALICLLHVRQETLEEYKAPLHDAYRRFLRANTSLKSIQWLDNTICVIMDDLLSERRDSLFLENVLWTAFPMTHNAKLTIRVLDYLQSPEAPEHILSHKLISWYFDSTWKYGFAPLTNQQDSWGHRALQRYDSLSTPRALYTLHLTTEIVALACLSSYLANPPALHATYTIDSFQAGFREIYLMLYSISSVYVPGSTSSFAFVCIILSFLFSYPELPIPGYVSFQLLFLAFFVRLYHYHLPSAPSPLFIFTPTRVLPLAIVFYTYVQQVFFPVIIFFIPILLFVTGLLMYTNTYDMDTRLTFLLALFATILLIIFFLFFLGVSINPARQVPTQTPASPPQSLTTYAEDSAWDRYSRSSGMEARAAFVRVVWFYGRPFAFPPPFNLLPLVFVQTPAFVFHLFGKEYPVIIEAVVWRLAVAPCAGIFGAIYWTLSPRSQTFTASEVVYNNDEEASR